MANNKFTYQQVSNVSINKTKLLDIATNLDFNERDLRVVLTLFTELSGWGDSGVRGKVDPLNFKRIDSEAMSDVLGIKKKEFKKSLKRLIEYGIIEEGESDTVSKGYRFTF